MTPFLDDFDQLRLQSTVRKFKDDFEIGMTLKKKNESDQLQKEIEFEHIVRDLDKRLMEFGASDHIILDDKIDDEQFKNINVLTQ